MASPRNGASPAEGSEGHHPTTEELWEQLRSDTMAGFGLSSPGINEAGMKLLRSAVEGTVRDAEERINIRVTEQIAALELRLKSA